MDENTQKLVDTFLQSCSSVDIFGYTLGVFVAHVDSHAGSFHYSFKKFNEDNGIRFSYVDLPNNMVAISES